MDLSECTDGLSVLCGGLPSALSQASCVAAEGQAEVRVKGSFPELPGGSSCFSCCAQPQTAVTNICWKCFRAMPQLAASAPGEWGTAPDPADGVHTPSQFCAKRSAPFMARVVTVSTTVCTGVFISLTDGGIFGVPLSATFSCPLMPFLLKLEFNSCVKYHRREIILKVWR